MSLQRRHFVSRSYDENSQYPQNDGRLLQRERTSHVLVQKAKRLNEDFLASLSNPADVVQAKAFLKDHIETITMAVTKLSKDIENLESQMLLRERSHKQSSHSVQNLELHHVGSISDLRSRVGRCDTSIARLSSQIRDLYECITNTSKQLQDLSNNLNRLIRDTSNNVLRLQVSLEKFEVQQDSKLKSVEGDSNHAISLLDTKTSSLIETVQKYVESTQFVNVTEKEGIKEAFRIQLDKAVNKIQMRQEQLDRKQADQLLHLDRKLEKLEKTLYQQQEEIHNLFGLENKVDSQLLKNNKATEKMVHDKMEVLQRENLNGLKSLQQSMKTMQSVVDGKRRLLAEDIRREMSQMKKLVVLT